MCRIPYRKDDLTDTKLTLELCYNNRQTQQMMSSSNSVGSVCLQRREVLDQQQMDEDGAARFALPIAKNP
jgi:hypothetical protein